MVVVAWPVVTAMAVALDMVAPVGTEAEAGGTVVSGADVVGKVAPVDIEAEAGGIAVVGADVVSVVR